MQIEPNENASKRMCTSQFSNRFVIAAAPHSGTHRNIGLQRVEASDLTLPTRFSVRGKDEIPMDGKFVPEFTGSLGFRSRRPARRAYRGGAPVGFRPSLLAREQRLRIGQALGRK